MSRTSDSDDSSDIDFSQLFTEPTQHTPTDNTPQHTIMSAAGANNEDPFEITADTLTGISSGIVSGTSKEGVYTDDAAKSCWDKMFTAYGVTQLAAKRDAMIRVLWYACLNSTSTQQGFQGKVSIGGSDRVMADVLAKLHVLPAQWRRFVRARVNITIIDQMMTNPEFAAVLMNLAQKSGIDPECYRAVLDIAEFLPSATRKELGFSVKLGRRRLHPDNVAAVVREEATVELATQRADHSTPPAPAGLGGW
jgi:hypothetical protein